MRQKYGMKWGPINSDIANADNLQQLKGLFSLFPSYFPRILGKNQKLS